MKDFIFQNTTKIYFGKDQLSNLGAELKTYGSRVLLVYGGGSIKRIGLYEKVMRELTASSFTVFELGGVEPNPRHTTVNEGAAICKKEKIDVILAVGGGSTIDCAKAVATANYYDGDCWDIVSGKVPVTQALPLCSILTIAATGSEMDCGGVISNIETNEKLALVHPLLQPKASFLDPSNTFTVNAYQTACGSIDILAHIFDCFYFAENDVKMDMIDRIMEEIIKTVIKYAPVAIKDPENYEARANLMWAASWALNGFLGTGTMMMPTCHMIEHELSAFYDITHGHGLAILIPSWMEYILDDSTAPQFKKFGINVFGLDDKLSDMEGAKAAIAKFEDFAFNTLGLKNRLSDLGIDDKHFTAMADKACQGDILHGYKPLKSSDIKNIFRMSL